MLVFNGIKMEFGTPVKFTQKYSLTASLKIALELAEKRPDNPGLGSEEILASLNSIYDKGKKSVTLDSETKQKVAILIRAKDILIFLDSISYPVEAIEAFKPLQVAGSPEQKWAIIKDAILNSILPKLGKTAEAAIQDESTGLHQFLSAVVLFLMDQIDERPPANVLLRFIPDSFPRHEWSTTDTVGEARSIPWTPDNPLCRLDYLITDLVAEQYKRQTVLISSSNSSMLKANNVALHSDSRSSYFSNVQSEPISISFPQKNAKSPTLPLIDTMEEAFLHFQRSLSQQFRSMLPSHLQSEGVRHWAGLFYMLALESEKETINLSLSDFYTLLYGKNAEKTSAKNRTVFKEILDLLLGIEVRRSSIVNGKNVEVSNRLLCVKATASLKEDDGSDPKQQLELKLIKDKLLIRTPSNIKPPGYALKFLPKEFFCVPSNVPSYYFEIGVYLANCWYDEFSLNSGTISKTPQDIIDKGGLYVPKSGGYRAVSSIKTALNYMEKMKVVSKLFFGDSTKKSKLEQDYSISAPPFVHEAISLELGSPAPYLAPA